MPPAIRDIVARFLHDEMAGINTWSGYWMRSDPERREAMVIQLADAGDTPRIVWAAMLAYHCFDTEPACAECGQSAWVYDCLLDGSKLPVHRFLCEQHAPTGRYPGDDRGGAAR
jgi:hypothetical protein